MIFNINTDSELDSLKGADDGECGFSKFYVVGANSEGTGATTGCRTVRSFFSG